MSKQELQTENYNLCQRGLELMDALQTGFLELGRILGEIRDTQAFYPSWEDFRSYLDEKKGISEAQASKLITVYRRFVVRMKQSHQKVVALGGWTLAYELHLLYPEDAELEEAMEDRALLNTTDLRIKNREKKTGINQETCTHADSYSLKICKTCGRREKIYESGIL